MTAKIGEQLERFMELRRIELLAVRAKVLPSTVPPGQLGPWTIENFSIEKGPSQLWPAARSMVRGERGYMPPGTYTRLVHKDKGVIMSDTLDECEDLLPIIDRAQGRVLVTGLGLGVAADSLLRKPDVSHVTVIEKHKRIIYLVGRHLMDLHGDALEIIRADAFAWKPVPGQRWDYAWHDIWDEISGDNVPEMGLLRSRYRHYITGQQMCWAEKQARKQR
jgi:hypothetical protein